MQLKFKTNINCGSCVRLVTPYLNETANISSWNVDTAKQDKVLTVDTSESVQKIIALVKEAGFEIESLN